jgi:hypothetical protein
VALKAMVDLWAGAANDRSALFAAALAVRQVEIGLDALLALVLAATFLGFGVGLLTAPPRARSLGVLVLITAGAAAVNGVALALGGFSDTAMLATTASSVLSRADYLNRPFDTVNTHLCGRIDPSSASPVGQVGRGVPSRLRRMGPTSITGSSTRSGAPSESDRYDQHGPNDGLHMSRLRCARMSAVSSSRDLSPTTVGVGTSYLSTCVQVL